jgi:type II secretory pathway pseudopilin PulG
MSLRKTPSTTLPHPFQAYKKRGFTLTEIGIVLGVVGLVLASIWGAMAHVSASNKAQEAVGQIQTILSGYQTMFVDHAVDSGSGQVDITAMGTNANIFPNEMVKTGAVLNPWGGTVTIWGDQANDGIIISYYGIPSSACVALASSEATAANLILSYVGKSGTSPHLVNYATKSPMTSTQITTYCADSSTNDEVSFDYKMN